jgi:hypothetical protein
MEVILSAETSVITKATRRHVPETTFFILAAVKILVSMETVLRFYMLFLLVRFEVFTAVTMKNGVFWDVTPCGSCNNRRFGGTWRLFHQGYKNR